MTRQSIPFHPGGRAFQTGKWYVMDAFALTMRDAYVSGPHDTLQEATRDRLTYNCAADLECLKAGEHFAREGTR